MSLLCSAAVQYYCKAKSPVLFVGFKKAYDYVYRASLINIFEKFNLVQASMGGTEITVKLENIMQKPVEVATDLRLG